MTKQAEGTVISLIAGFYDVELDNGEIIRTRARGAFRQKKQNQRLETMLKLKLMIRE